MPVGAHNAGPRPFDSHLVEYLVLVVPDEQAIDGLVDAVVGLAAAGPAAVLDGAIVRRDVEGSTSMSELPASAWERMELATPRGVLSKRDLTMIAEALSPSTVGVVVVVEDRWALPLADAAREAGGEIAGGERIPPARLQSVLSSLERSSGDLP